MTKTNQTTLQSELTMANYCTLLRRQHIIGLAAMLTVVYFYHLTIAETRSSCGWGKVMMDNYNYSLNKSAK